MMPDIPKRFHRIWLGSPIPERAERFWAKWQELHPDWELLTWTEDSLGWLDNWELFAAARTFAEKADIARYEILVRFGGVYLDCDFEALQNIDAVLEGVQAFSAWEDSEHVAIGIMGCVPAHPFFKDVVQRLPFNVVMYEDHATNRRTGPLFFTEVIREHPDVTLFPPPVFYPYHYTEEDPGTYPDTALAVHHWTGSWV